jgi:hypothetical protein
MKTHILIMMFLLPLITMAQYTNTTPGTFSSGNLYYPASGGYLENTPSTSTIYNGTATVTYSAANNIRLLPGFKAGTYSGSGYFRTLTTPLLGSTTVTSVSCRGGSNGTASVTASGGYPSYTYLWSTGSTNTTITGLAAGTYTCTITDSKSQQIVKSATVTQPATLPSVTRSLGTPKACDEYDQGTVNIHASGGTGPYTCVGCTSGSSPNFSYINESSNTYSVTITDHNGCNTNPTLTMFTINSYKINGVDLALGIFKLENVYLVDNYYFSVSGSIFQNCLWNTWDQRSSFNVIDFDYYDNNSVEQHATNSAATPNTVLATGLDWNYITIKDNITGCTQQTISHYKKSPNSVTNAVGENVSINIYPNPTQNTLYVSSNSPIGDAVIKLYDMQGRMVYDENIIGSAKMDKEINVSAFTKGIYQLQIISNNSTINKKVIIE